MLESEANSKGETLYSWIGRDITSTAANGVWIV